MKQNKQLISDEGFKNPINKYRGLRIVHQYTEPTGETFAEKAQSVKDIGWGGVATNDWWKDDYLKDEESLKKLNTFVQELHKTGLRVWIYDERGYPSGAAGGLTVKEDGTHQAINLWQFTVDGEGTAEHSMDIPKDFIKLNSISILQNDAYTLTEGIVKDGKITFNGIEGKWQAFIYCVIKNDHTNNTYAKTYPNLLNRDAVKEYIDNTFETYSRSIDGFENIVEAFFDDEPYLTAIRHDIVEDGVNPALPYDYDIFETFKAKYGYDIVPLLPLVFNSLSSEAQRARSQYFSHLGDLMSENYYAQIQGWCRAHNVMLSGHLLLEEGMKYHLPLYGDYVQCSHKTGYPGFDILCSRPEIYFKEVSLGSKYASSPAWLDGKERVFFEICFIHNPPQWQEDSLKCVLNILTFAYFDGGNQLASYYGQANSKAEYGRPLNEYIGRMGSVLVGAQNKNQVAVLYTINSASATYIPPVTRKIYHYNEISKEKDELVSELTLNIRANGLDYVFLDEESLQKGTVENNVLKVGRFDFKTIIVPRGVVLDIQTARTLDTLIKNGANVIFVKEMPALSFMECDQSEFNSIFAGKEALLAHDATEAVKRITTAVKLTVDSDKIYVSPYEKDEEEFYFLANASDTDITVTFNYEGVSKFRIYDPATSEILQADSGYTIMAYRGIFVQPIIE